MIRKPHLITCHIDDIFKFYKQIKHIGKGAYGEVFRVQKISTGEIFACKKILKANIRKKARLKKEIDLLKSTDHPNIIKLYDIFENNLSIYLVMEECMGGEFFYRLAKRAKENKMYTEKEAVIIFKQILEAINYLHAHGVCHRDMKPENILFSTVEEDSPIKIIDFGLSSLFSVENPIITGSAGTSFYMAPEVINGQYDSRCDIWSCGVILYLMLSGRPPFYATNEKELEAKILSMKYSLNNINISEDAKNFLKSIFVPQSQRPTAEQLLEHKWIKELAPNSNNATLNIDWNHMQKYCKLNLVQKCVINFTSFRLSEKETEQFAQMFKSLDANSDGVLTIEEIKNGLDKCSFLAPKISVEDLINMFNEMDVDKNGLVNFTEFLSALVDYNQILKKEKLLDCFHNYDLDGNDSISFEEFIDMIKPSNEDEKLNLKKLFDKFDTNKDGVIDFNEFCNGVMDKNIVI